MEIYLALIFIIASFIFCNLYVTLQIFAPPIR